MTVISLVEVLNYKSLRYVQVPLDEFHILVGPNASGKSAFFDVLLFLKDLLNIGAEGAVRQRAQTLQELVWQQQEKSFEIAVEFLVPEDLRAQNGLHPYPACRYIVQISVDENEGIAVTGEQLWLMRKQSPDRSKEQKTSLFPQEPNLPESETLLIPRYRRPPRWFKSDAVVRRTETKDYFRSEIDRWSPSARYARVRPAITYVPEEERFPVATWVRKLLSERIQLLQLNPIAMRRPCPPDAPRSFQPDGSNLPMMVRQLKEREPKTKFRWWLEHLKVVLPNLEDVSVEEFPHNRFLYLQTRFAPKLTVPQWLLSDGTLRLMALTLLPYVMEAGSVWLIEEPENGIHPTAIEEVFKALEPPNNGQILIATHSPMFLSLLRPKDLRLLLCFARTESGATDIVRGDLHPHLKRWHGEVNLSVYFAGGVLA